MGFNLEQFIAELLSIANSSDDKETLQNRLLETVVFNASYAAQCGKLDKKRFQECWPEYNMFPNELTIQRQKDIGDKLMQKYAKALEKLSDTD